MAEAQDVDSLRRRGRRRLVGAVALVLLAVIVLPMVFDPEPRRSGPPVSVRIPGEDDSSFAPKMAKAPEKAPSAEAKVEPKKADAPKAEEKLARVDEKKSDEKASAEKKAEPRSEVKLAERQRAEAALAGGGFMVPVGAFANPEPVTARLKEARLPYYTEQVPTAKGTVTRVRAGPFPSKEAADKAHQQLKGLGLKPGNVASKAG